MKFCITLIYFLFSFTAIAQNTSNCCPLAKSPIFYLQESEVVTSCLLCSKFKTRTKEEVIERSLADEDAFAENLTLKKMQVETLSNQQRAVISDITDLIQFSNKHFSEKFNSLEDVLKAWEPLVSVQIANEINSVSKINKAQSNLQCKDNTSTPPQEIVVGKNATKEYLSRVSQLYLDFTIFGPQMGFKGYEADKKEKKILDDLAGLHKLNQSIHKSHEE